MIRSVPRTTHPIADVIVIGGGIVGAACAWALSNRLKVVLLEAEDVFGYHATGRSAALYSQYFGDPLTMCLTEGSRQFFEMPPNDISQDALLFRRGTVALATAEEHENGAVEAALAIGSQKHLPVELIDLARAQSLCPILYPRGYVSAVYRPATWDIDVEALHQGFMRVARQRGATILNKTQLTSLMLFRGIWMARSETRSQCHEWQAPVVINAAGAWADEVARLAGVEPLGLIPKKRTVVYIALPSNYSDLAIGEWPMINDLADTFYFKPQNDGIIASPCDVAPSIPCDAQPEEFDIAVAADRVERVTCLKITRISNKWAGLRTFSPDQMPILGQASETEGFYWAAGLGGAGIQTAPAVGRVLASLIADGDLPDELKELGLTRKQLSPSRLLDRNASTSEKHLA
jgi:D-arginine dehydrogenase